MDLHEGIGLVNSREYLTGRALHDPWGWQFTALLSSLCGRWGIRVVSSGSSLG